MTTTLVLAAALAALAAAPAPQAKPEAKDCPMHQRHAAKGGDHGHHDRVDRRGDAVMGFGHAVTRHRFRLTPDGGVIRVTANDAADAASRDGVRAHLKEIAHAFAAGDFSMPEAIHGRVPPGVPAMRERRAAIAYTYEDVENGGQVRIRTADTAALAAVHDFLEFQIEDHRTGDPVDVSTPN